MKCTEYNTLLNKPDLSKVVDLYIYCTLKGVDGISCITLNCILNKALKKYEKSTNELFVNTRKATIVEINPFWWHFISLERNKNKMFPLRCRFVHLNSFLVDIFFSSRIQYYLLYIRAEMSLSESLLLRLYIYAIHTYIQIKKKLNELLDVFFFKYWYGFLL